VRSIDAISERGLRTESAARSFRLIRCIVRKVRKLKCKGGRDLRQFRWCEIAHYGPLFERELLPQVGSHSSSR
jgi:hypothetical protein